MNKLWIIMIIILLPASAASAANIYVRDGASGGSNLVQIRTSQNPTNTGGITHVMTSADGSSWSVESTSDCPVFEARSE